MSKSWTYIFDDKDNTIDNFLFLWKANIEILITNNEKMIVIMDITNTNIFSMTKIMKIISFISFNKRKLKLTNEKIQILTSSENQVRMIQNALSLSPVRICEFEILKNVAEV
jgi:transcription antitermination factor NusA-like protein